MSEKHDPVHGIVTEVDRDRANFKLQAIVAGCILLVNTFLLLVIASVNIPPKNDAAFNIFLGNAMGWFGALIAFCFPSSMGSMKKDSSIATLSAAAAAPSTVTTKTTTTRDGSTEITSDATGNTANERRPSQEPVGAGANVDRASSEPDWVRRTDSAGKRDAFTERFGVGS